MTDALMSNGTCYYAKGKKSDKEMIPCGNAAYGHIPCCQAGDFCMSSNACFNAEFGVTYLTGCTDKDYADKSCPDKKAWDDQPWAGLVYCNGTSNQWVACEEKGKEPTLTKADACWCPENGRMVAFSDEKNLTRIGTLPTALGEPVDFEKGFLPTGKTLTDNQPGKTDSQPSKTDNQPSQTDSQPSQTDDQSIQTGDLNGGDGGGGGGGSSFPTGGHGSSGSTPAPIKDGSDSGSGSGGLSSGGKIGLGVGVAVVALLLLAALAFLFMRRRKQLKGTATETATVPDDPRMDLTKPGLTPDTPATSAPSELESRGARPWSMRSELQTPDTPLVMADRVEMDGTGGEKNGHQFQGQKNSRPEDVPPPSGPGPNVNAGAPGKYGSLSTVAELPG